MFWWGNTPISQLVVNYAYDKSEVLFCARLAHGTPGAVPSSLGQQRPEHLTVLVVWESGEGEEGVSGYSTRYKGMLPHQTPLSKLLQTPHLVLEGAEVCPEGPEPPQAYQELQTKQKRK